VVFNVDYSISANFYRQDESMKSTALLPIRKLSARIILALVLVLLASAASAIHPAFADTVTWYVNVSSGNDGNDCSTSGSACKTLTAAISKASAGDTIVLSTGTYSATSGEVFPITIDKDLTIRGASASGTILYRTGASQRVVAISGSDVDVVFENLTIRGGSDTTQSGGGIYADGISSLTLNNVIVRNNSGYHGGAIAMLGGTLTLNNSTFTSNSAQLYGGAVYIAGGVLNISGSTFTSNIANRGGAVYNSGATVTITGSQINNGIVTANGGGIYNASGAMSINNTSLAGNSAAAGGAIYLVGGSVDVVDSTFGSSNTAANGAGILQAGGILTVTRSLFTSNTASTAGSALSLTAGSATLTNLTLTGNQANGSGADGGGAITVSGSASATLNSSTLSGNSAVNADRGGLWVSGGSLAVQNVLFNASTCSGAFTDNGGSLDSGASCDLAVERNNINFNLGPLSANGGATMTLALLPGSPAIDAGSCAESVDQRGIARPKDGNADGSAVCDTGAYEFVSPTITFGPDALEYYDGDLPLPIDLTATLDDDALSYNGGTLTVSLGESGTADDRLSIISANPITLSGAYIQYAGGGVIGTFSGGTSGSDPLVISLTASATPQAVQALIRNIAYANESVNPQTHDRSASFVLDDGAGTVGRTASQTIHVHSINQTPELSDFSRSLSEDGYYMFSQVDFLNAYSDQDGEQMVSIKISDLPANGTLSLLGVYVTLDQELSLSDLDLLSYTPYANYFGADNFQWLASDGTAYSDFPANVNLLITPVNDLPTEDDFSVSLAEDASYSFTLAEFAAHFNDSDTGDELVNLKVTALPAQGALTLNGSAVALNQVISAAELDTLVYTPSENYYGSDQLSVLVKDNLDYAAAAATVSIAVNAVNDAPEISAPATAAVSEDVPAAFTEDKSVQISDIDAEDGSLQVSLTVTQGSLSLEDISGLTFTSGDGTNDASLVFSGTLTDLNTALAGLSYLGGSDYYGADTLTIQVDDNGHTGTPGALTASQVIDLDVAAVNDQPTLDQPADLTIDEDAAEQTVALTGISSGAANESQTLTVSALSSNTALIPDPVITYTSPDATAALAFTPVSNAVGSADITVRVSDDGDPAQWIEKTFTVTITGLNDAPVVHLPAAQSTNEDQTLTLSAANAISISDVDAGSNELAVTLTAANGTVDLASVAGLTFTTGDGSGDALMSFSGNLSAINTALDGLTFLPDQDFYGSASMRVYVDDQGFTGQGGSQTADQTLDITVVSQNDAPVNHLPETQTMIEDAALVFSVANGNALSISDVDAAAPIEVSLSITNALLSLGSSADLTFTTGDGSADATMVFSGAIAAINTALDGLTLTPEADYFGNLTLTLQSNDLGSQGAGGAQSATDALTITVEAQNDAPSFSKGADQNIGEDAGAQSVTGWATLISAGPANESGQQLDFIVSYEISSGDAGLFAVPPAISPAGVLSFTLAADANGAALVTVSLHDDGGTANGGADTSATQTFTITVNAVNDAPIFTPGAAELTVLEDSGSYSAAWASAISSGPSNESSQTLSFAVTAADPALFSVQPAIDGEGVLTFTPAADANGTVNITVVLEDNGGGSYQSAEANIALTITPVNDVPFFTKGADQAPLEDSGETVVSNWAQSISAGATNESSQTLTFHLSNDNPDLFAVQPAVNAAGDLSYTLNADVNSSATLSIWLSDNGGTAFEGADTSATQTFSLAIAAVNDTPSFTKGSDIEVDEDASAQTVSGWAQDISAGPENESAQILTFNITGNTVPALFAAGPALSSTGELTFTPAADAFGTSQITITLSDDGGGANTSAPQSFNITLNAVNDAPTIDQPADLTIDEDDGQQTVNLSGISSGAANETQQLVLSAVSDNPSLIADPAVSYSSPDSTASLTFTPAAGAYGSAQITVRVTDDGEPASYTEKTFNVTVNAVNDAPVNAVPAAQTIDEDQTLVFSAANSNAISVSDSDAGVNPLQVTLSADHGSISLAGELTNLEVSGQATHSVTVSGTQMNINAALNGLTYQPDENYNGSDSLTILTDDQGYTGGSALTDSDSVSITLNAVNDAPSFTQGSDITVLEDAGAQTRLAWATDFSTGASDESAQTLDLQISTDNDSLFQVLPAIDMGSGDLTFTPAADANGSATVTVTLTDNGGGDDTSTTTFTITVTAVNDAPSFTKGSDQSIFEDAGAQTISNWAADIIPGGGSDESGQALHFELSADNTGLFSVQPAISADGTLTYTPAANAAGSAVVQVSLYDDGDTANGGSNVQTQTFNIVLNGINDAPAFTKGADITVLEDAAEQSISDWATGITPGGGVDESAQALTFNVTNNTNPALFSSQPAVTAAGTLSFTPAANASGSATITLTLSDDGGTANGGVDTSGTQTFTINVTAVNDAPSFTKGSDISIAEDAGAQTFTGWATNLQKGPADEAGQTLSFQVSNNNNPLFSVQPAISATGGLTFTAAANANGSATVSVAIHDNGGTANGGVDTSAIQTFTITVTAVNDAPVNQVPGAQTTNEDQALVLTGASRITIVDDAGTNPVEVTLSATHGTLTLSSTTGLTISSGANGSASLTATGTLSAFNTALTALTFTPAANYNGPAAITIVTNDQGNVGSGGAKSDTDTINVTINAVNDAPVNSVPEAQTTPEDSVLSISGLSVSDADASSARVSLSVAHGVLTLASTNGLTFNAGANASASMTIEGTLVNLNAALNGLQYQPALNFNGSDTLTQLTSDLGATGSGGTLTDSDSVSLTVSAVNDAPVNTVPGAQATPEDTPLSINGVSLSDVDAAVLQVRLDVEHGLLTLASTANLTFSVGDGSPAALLEFTGALTDLNAALNSIQYTPDANFNGSDSLTLLTSDLGESGSGGALTDSDSISLTVSAVNDDPVNHLPEAQTTPEDTSLIFSTANGNPISVADVDDGDNPADNETLTLDLSVSSGTLSLPAGSYSLDSILGDHSAALSLSGTIADLNAALDGLTYTPAANFNGEDALSLSTADLGFTGSGDPAVIPGSVAISVSPVNDAPLNSLPADQSLDEDSLLTFSAANSNPISVADVDDTDNPADNETLTLDLSVSSGSLSLPTTTGLSFSAGDGLDDALLTFSGAIADLNTALDGLTFTPDPNFFGDVVLSLSSADLGFTGSGDPLSDTDTITLHVLSLNDDPLISLPDSALTDEDSPLTLSAIAVSDVDAASDLLHFTLAVQHGSLAFSDPAALAFIDPSLNNSSSLDFNASLADFSAALANGLAYSPDLNFNGEDLFSISVNDLGHNGSGGAADISASFPISVAPLNDAPSFTPGPDISLNEDAGPQTAAAWATDISSGGGADEAGQSLSFSLSNDNNALFAVQPAIDPLSGDLSFTPADDANGSAVVSLSLQDDGLANNASPLLSFTITVNAVNDAPSFSLGADISVAEDSLPYAQPWTAVYSPGPADEAGQALSFTLSADPQSLFAVQPALSPSGVLSFTPAPNAYGTASISIHLSDDGGTDRGGLDTSPDQSFSITITPVNDAPSLSLPSAQTTPEDTPLTLSDTTRITVSDDAGSEDVQVTLSAAHGMLTLNGISGLTFSNGSGSADASMTFTGTLVNINAALNGLTYTPTLNYNGSDTLAVSVNDLGHTGGNPLTINGSLNLTVSAVNDAPVNNLPPTQNIDEDTALYFSGTQRITISDVDAGSATIQVNLTAARGLVSLGSTSGVTFLLGDGVLDSAITMRGSITALNNVLNNTIFFPNANAVGAAGLTVATNDLGYTGGSPQTTTTNLAINLNPVNDDPVNHLPDAQTTPEDTSLIFSAANGNPISVADVDDGDNPADNETLTLDLSVSSGTLSLPAGSYSLDAILGDHSAALSLSGTIADLNAALDGLTYTPAANFNGEDALSLSTADLGFTGSGDPAVIPGSVAISVSPVNDAPLNSLPADQSLDEDSLLTFSAANSNPISVADVDDTDNPADNETLTLDLSVSSGSLSLPTTTGLSFSAGDGLDDALLTFSGAIADLNTALDGLTFTPDPNFFGDVVLSLSSADLGFTGSGDPLSDTDTITLHVLSLNDDPLISLPDSALTDEDSPLTLSAIAVSDVDAASDLLHFTLAVQHGSLAFSDPAALAFIDPSLNNSSSLDFNASLADFSAALANGLAYSPDLNFNGEDLFSISVNDLGHNGSGGAADISASFPISVAPLNDAPSFTPGPDISLNEDAGPQTAAAWATDISSGGGADEAGQSLSFSLSNDNNALFAVQPAIDPLSGDLSFTPADDANGSAVVSLSLQDDGLANNASPLLSFTITVNAVNDAPSFSLGADISVAEDSLPYAQPWTAVYSPGPADEAGQALSFTLSADPQSLFAVQPALSPSGVLSFTPAPNAYGTASISIHLSDDGGTDRGGLDTSPDQSFSITITPVNDAPSLSLPSAQTTPEDTPLTLNGFDLGDVDATILTVSIGVSHGSLTLASAEGITLDSGSNPGVSMVLTASAADLLSALNGLVYQPEAEYNGSDELSVLVDDNGQTGPEGSQTAQGTVAITVTSQNDAPTLDSIADQTINEDAVLQTMTLTGISTGADNEADTLTFQAVSDNPDLIPDPNISYSSGGSATLFFAPQADANSYALGTATITVTIDDGQSENNLVTRSFTVTVTPINDQPTFTKGESVTVNEDSGASTIDNWATAIAAGPANEISQVLTFHVSNDNNALFSQQPDVTPDGRLTFTPQANAFGFANISIWLSDDGGTANGGVNATTIQNFVITVNPVNDAPSFTKGADESAAEDSGAQSVSAWATAIAAGPANESGQVVAFSLSTDHPEYFAAAPAVSSSGTLTYTPAANAFGIAAVSIRISDNGGTEHGGTDQSVEQTFNITLTAVNDAPVNHLPAAQTTQEDTALTLSTENGNAISISDDALDSPIQVTLAALNGTLNLAGTQGLTVSGDGSANVTITGTLADINTIALDGLVFTPALNFNGSGAQITVSTNDQGYTGGGALSDSDVLAITVTAVNDPPTFTHNGDVTVPEDYNGSGDYNSSWASNLSAGAQDETGQTLSFAVVTDDESLFTVSPAIDASGNLSFTTIANAHGSTLVHVRLFDGVDYSDEVTFTLTITSVNDAPVNTLPGIPLVDEDTPITLAGISVSDVDAAGDALTFDLSVENGWLHLEQTAGLSFNATYPNDSAHLQFDASQSDFNAAMSSLVYHPDADFNETETLTVVSNDQGHTGSGGALSDTDQLIFTINPVNDAPTFTSGGNISVDEDQYSASAYAQPWASDISAGPADEAAQTLIFSVENDHNSLFTTQPAMAANGVLTFQTVADAYGSAEVTVTLSDGSANSTSTFTLTVNAVNDLPVFTAGGDVTADEDSGSYSAAWATAIAAGPANESEQTLTFAVQNDNNSLFAAQPAISPAGVLTFETAEDAYGSAQVVVRLSDGIDQTAEVNFTITLDAVNDQPVNSLPGDQQMAEDDSLTLTSIAVSDVDAQDELHFVLQAGHATLTVVDPTGLTFINGSANTTALLEFTATQSAFNTAMSAGLVYQPAADFNGSDSLTLTSDDQGSYGSGGALTDSDTIQIVVNAVNDLPAISLPAGPLETAEDTALTITTIHISDVDAGSASLHLQFSVTQGLLTFNDASGLQFNGESTNGSGLLDFDASLSDLNTALANGLVFQPAANANGSESIRITVNDQGNTGSGEPQDVSANLAVDVTSVNDDPTLTVPAAQSTGEDTQLSLNGFALSDVEASSLRVTLSVNQGTLTLSSTTGLTISAGADNSPAMTLEGAIADLETALNRMIYLPDLNFNGTDQLSVLVSDLGVSGAGGIGVAGDTVDLTVIALNDPPQLTAPASLSTAEDTPFTVTGVSLADVDASQLEINLAVTHGVLTLADLTDVSLTAGALDSPSLTLTGPISALNASLTGLQYTPDENFNGSDSLSLLVSDLGNSGTDGVKTDSASVTLEVSAVNDAPVNLIPAAQTTAEDTALTLSGPLAIQVADVDDNDAPDNQSLQVTLSVAYGTLSLPAGEFTLTSVSGDHSAALALAGEIAQLNLALDGLSYLPAENFNGSDSLAVTTSDDGYTGSGGSLTGSDTIAITVTAVNDAPLQQAPESASTAEDTALVFSSANNRAITLSDPDDNDNPLDDEVMELHLEVTNGSLTLAATNGLTFTSGDGSADTSLTFTGVISDLNSALDGLSFMPDSRFNGSALLTVQSSDQGYTGAGGGLSAQSLITIQVDALNNPPEISLPASADTDEDTGLILSGISVSDVDAGSGSMHFTLGVAHGSLTFAAAAGLSFDEGFANGDAVLSFAAAQADFNTAALGLTYLPDADYNGSDAFTLTVNDNGNSGSGEHPDVSDSFAISIQPVNDTPAFTKGADVTVNEDAGAQTLTNWVSALTPGGAADESGQTLTFHITANSNPGLFSAQPQISSSGTLTFTPADNANGSASLSVTLQDNGGGADTSEVQSFNIIVNAVNDAPAFTAGSDVEVNEDSGAYTSAWASGLSTGPADESDQTLTFSATGYDAALFAVAPVIDASGVLTFTPAADANGSATVTVSLSDNGGTAREGVDTSLATASLNISITAVNDAPQLTAPAALTAEEDIAAALTGFSISDVDANSFSVSLAVSQGILNLAETQGISFAAGSNASAVMTLTGSGSDLITALNSLTYQGDTDFNGSAALTVTVSDLGAAGNGGPLTDTATVSITVNAVNDDPTLDAIDDLTVAEDSGMTVINLSGIGSGAADEVQELTLSADSNLSSLVDLDVIYTSPDATAVLQVTPLADAFGQTDVTVTLSDGVSQIQRTFTVTVSPVNDPPSFTPGGDVTVDEESHTYDEGLAWAADIVVGPANEAGQSAAFTITANSNPDLFVSDSLLIDSTGKLFFTLMSDAAGYADITYTFSDGSLAEAQTGLTFRITVTNLNDAPTLDDIAGLEIAEDSPEQTVLLSGISSGAANEDQTLTVTAESSDLSIIPGVSVDYTSPNNNASLSFTPAADAFGSVVITVRVNDGVDTTQKQFTVSVTPVNDGPSFTAGGDVTVSEDDEPYQAPWATDIFIGPQNEIDAGQTGQFQISANTNPGLFSESAQPVIDSSGMLQFALTPNANGWADLTVSLTDGVAATADVTLRIIVSAVNDAPTLDEITAVNLNEDDPAVQVDLTGITSGADDEIQTLTVSAVSSDPSLLPDPTVDYLTPSQTGTLTLTPAADAHGSATITVTVDDGEAQTSRDFTVNISPVNDAPTLDAIVDWTVIKNTGPFTIDLAGIGSGADNESDEIQISAESNNPALIPNPDITYSSPDQSGQLTFQPLADATGSAEITITVNDGQPENNLTQVRFTVTVLANGVLVNPAGGLVVTEAGGAASFSVRLVLQPAADVIITLQTSNPAESLLSVSTLTFTPENWSSEQTVTVTGVDDAIDDGNQNFQINLTASSSDGMYNDIEIAPVTGTNQDNDTAGFSVSPVSGLTTSETGTTASFTVHLLSQPLANVTLTPSSTDTGEGTVSPASLTFTGSNWNTPQTVTVTGVDDAENDGDIAYRITFAAPTSSDALYAALVPASVTLTNLDNEIVHAPATPAQGGTVTQTDADGNAITVQVPANGVSSPVEIYITPLSAPQTPSNYSGTGQDFRVTVGTSQTYTFQQPVYITFHYTDAAMAGVNNENSLTLFRQVNSEWKPAACGTVTRDASTNTLRIPVCQAGTFSLFGVNEHHVYLPVIITP